ncbi:MAG: histidine phosphatase family protein [Candidatus Anstonellaceae archaeon]
MITEHPYRPEILTSVEDAEILRLKNQTGQRIAVILPALNEEETIGTISSCLLEKRNTGIIDELVVVDSGSTDNTIEICKQLGVPTYDSDYVLRQIGIEKNIRGKGVNLYLGQFLTSAPIIVYLDSDQNNFDSQVVNRLVYPLLANPKTMMTKSVFQRRSFGENGQLISFGGRVTMLTVKPVLDIFFPQLSDIFQPINGNVAVRRSSTECIPFFSQYEADLQLLLETFWRYGRESIAQVFCGIFEQNGQDMTRLQKVAFQYIHFLLDFLSKLGIININQPLNYHLMQYDNVTGNFSLYNYEPFQFPPALAITDYEKRFATQITIIRHAPTPYNLTKRIQGQTDIEIDSQVLDQYLIQLGSLPKPELIVTSGLTRSKQTAEAIINHFHWSGVPLITDPRFNERKFGDFEGKTRHDLRQNFPNIDAIMEGAIDYRPPNGELIAEVRERVWQGLKDLRRLYPGTKILLVTHAGAMLSLNLNPNHPNNLIVSRKEDGNYFIRNI